MSIQEICYIQTNSYVEEDEESSAVYALAVKNLNKYVSHKHSKAYKGHTFQEIKQEPEKVLVRLRIKQQRINL